MQRVWDHWRISSPDIIRRLIIVLAYVAGVWCNLLLWGHRDFPESRWAGLVLLARDAACWLVAWLAWADGARSAWRRVWPGLGPKERDRFVGSRVPMLLLLILGALCGIVPGAEQVSMSGH